MQKSFFPLLLALVAASTTAFGQAAKAPDAKTQAQLVALEKGIWEQSVHNQTSLVETNVAPDFLMASGTTKAALIQLVKDQHLKSFTFSSAKAKMLDTNTVLLTSMVTQVGDYKGTTLPAKIACGTVYVRRGGKWLLVFHSEEPQ